MYPVLRLATSWMNGISVGVSFSVPVQTGPGAHPASRTMGTVYDFREKSGQGVALTNHPI